ncbi:MAG: hypothetical protein IPO92_05975 [Saprospiraceae bacterium]|nr:hypothetical protein [Saprospiraceae bacterium]
MPYKPYFILFFLVNLFLGIRYGHAQADWKIFSPENQPYEVFAPGEMKYGEKNLLTDVGEIKVVTYMHEGAKSDPNFIYLINYVDYPEGTFHPDSTELIDDLFKISIKTNLNDLKGELVYSTSANYGVYPGMLYRATYNKGNAIIKSKMFLIGDRFYALQVYTLSEKSLNPEMDRFLDSFKAKLKN